jgi:ribosome-associated protein
MRAVNSTTTDSRIDWIRAGAHGADEKQAEDAVILDVGDLIGITEWFLIVSGRNARQVRAIVDEVEHQIVEAGGPRPLWVEGLETYQWVLMDYGDFLVHVFDLESRANYDLERLWSDCDRVDTGLEPDQESRP